MSNTEQMVSELLPCPFCKAAMHIESNRDWHRVMGEHDEECVFLDPETMMVPATDEQRELLVRDWNRRKKSAAQHQGEPVELPARKPQRVTDDYAAGWNAYNDEMVKLGPLYTHADPGKVERLQQQIEQLKGGGQLLVQDRNELRDGVGRLRKGIAKHWKVVCDQRSELDTLRAQMAERDALLARVVNYFGDPSWKNPEGAALWAAIGRLTK